MQRVGIHWLHGKHPAVDRLGSGESARLVVLDRGGKRLRDGHCGTFHQSRPAAHPTTKFTQPPLGHVEPLAHLLAAQPRHHVLGGGGGGEDCSPRRRPAGTVILSRSFPFTCTGSSSVDSISFASS